MDSILTSVKKELGIAAEYTAFDEDVTTGINTALAVCTQLGVGPKEGFYITDDTAVWSDFVPEGVTQNLVRSYIVKKVKLLFDPPTGGVLDALQKVIAELEWRLNASVDFEEKDGD